MKSSSFFFILAILSTGLIYPAIAASVVYENNSLVIRGVPDDGIGLGAFDIVLLYPEDVQVSGVTLVPPFTGAVNDQQEGRVVLAGFQVSDVLTGDVPVASLTVAGDPDSLDIKVRSLLNQRTEEILRTNADYSESVSPSDGGSDGSGVSSGSQTPVTSGVERSTGTGSSGTSSGKVIEREGTEVAIDSQLKSVMGSDENTTPTPDVPVSSPSNPVKETTPQRSPLSWGTICMSVGVLCIGNRILSKMKRCDDA
ncbi:hypothetical protein RJ40_08905 [Methanofollis aquaemaris]|uniref:Uncharacterized protein n=1 Tax=Methanofollis aquaemaris TaxID=126734 RepID=A0A8A3S7N9_9EURY|nr:hypothetical protein [Methanofollis aquaemaris]QSZ67616.1 hypothetical protein RJ40_08905 [Methanofollis aquaemaris]